MENRIDNIAIQYTELTCGVNEIYQPDRIVFEMVGCFQAPNSWSLTGGDKVDYRLSYQPVRLHKLAGRYDNPMPEATLSPSKGL
jgi:hypothetical protein